MSDDSCQIEKLEKAGDFEGAAKVWRENIDYMLRRCPYTVRVREGGGPESLLDSLLVTFMKMQKELEKKES